MKNQKERFNELLCRLRLQGSKFSIWNSDLSEKLISTVESHTKSKVKGVLRSSGGTSKKSWEKENLRHERCKHFDRIPVHLLPNCASFISKKNNLSLVDQLFGEQHREWKSSSEVIS